MRVVLDANVLISAVISEKGNPAEILRRWEKQEFDLVISPPILEEVERVIHYPRIQEKYNLPEEEVEEFLDLICGQTILVEPQMKLKVIERDPEDNRYLECATTGGADYIVSGDDHLLGLESYEGVEILSPTGFLALLKVQERG